MAHKSWRRLSPLQNSYECYLAPVCSYCAFIFLLFRAATSFRFLSFSPFWRSDGNSPNIVSLWSSSPTEEKTFTRDPIQISHPPPLTPTFQNPAHVYLSLYGDLSIFGRKFVRFHAEKLGHSSILHGLIRKCWPRNIP